MKVVKQTKLEPQILFVLFVDNSGDKAFQQYKEQQELEKATQRGLQHTQRPLKQKQAEEGVSQE